MDESKALTTTTPGEMTVVSVVDRKRKILEVMKAVMREGEHYGKIPGCGDKPALLKSGAEVLANAFGLSPRFKVVRGDLAAGHREYEVTCRLVHIESEKLIAEGLGSCTTMETKYRWRRGERVCPSCGKSGVVIKGKAEYGGGWLCYAKKGGCGSKWREGAPEIEGQSVDRVENPDIADTYNTVLKMAKKRAQIDATLTAVGASDILAQDLDDLPLGSAGEIEVEYDEDTWQPAPMDRAPRRDDRPPTNRDQRERPSDEPPPDRTSRAAPSTQRSAPASAGTGDAAWDDLLEFIGRLTQLDTAGWLPADLREEWDRRVAATTSKGALNAFAPWIGEAAKRGQSSKACAEIAAHMRTSFNAQNAELGKRAKGAGA